MYFLDIYFKCRTNIFFKNYINYYYFEIKKIIGDTIIIPIVVTYLQLMRRQLLYYT